MTAARSSVEAFKSQVLRHSHWYGRARALAAHADVRRASVVTAGTAAAQIVLFATMPMLSRLYGPESFGRLALLVSISTIGGAVATLCYNHVVLLARRVSVAPAAYRLCLLASLLGAVLIGALAAAAAHGFLQPISGLPLLGDAVLASFGILATAWFNVVGAALARFDRFTEIAQTKVVMTALPAFVQIGLGLVGALNAGLQVGRVLGQVLAVLPMARRLPPGFRFRDLLRPRLRSLRVVAARYADSIVQIPRILLVRASTSLPALLVMACYGPVAAGFYFLAERLIERPGMLLGDTLTRLPMRTFAELIREERPLARTVLAYTLACSAVVVPGVLVVAAGGPWLFGLLFGEAWRHAAYYAIPLAVLAGFRLSALPMSTLIPVLRLQRSGIAVESVFFLRLAVFPAGAWLGYGPESAVAAFALASVAYNCAVMAVAAQGVRAYERRLGHLRAGARLRP